MESHGLRQTILVIQVRISLSPTFQEHLTQASPKPPSATFSGRSLALQSLMSSTIVYGWLRESLIVANEDAHLHLVWHHNKIYVKPLPLCLLNYDFWTTYLPLQVDSTSSEKGTFAIRPVPPSPVFDRAAAVGFMRSYALLVRHHVDFILACESHLFPAKLDWIKWSEFIAHFQNIEDEDVAKRYHYGQLRLSRLNWAVRLFRPSAATTWWFYEIPHWSTATYVERAVAPLLFGFASLSLVLSSMQVSRSVPDEELGFKHLDASSLVHMRRAFWVFSTMILLLSGLIWVLLFAIPFSVLIWQLAWGFRNRGKSKAT